MLVISRPDVMAPGEPSLVGSKSNTRRATWHPLAPFCHVHISQDQNCETLFSELMCTSVFLTHSTPRTSEKVLLSVLRVSLR